MNLDAMRSALVEFRSAAGERAATMKDSQFALDELIRLHGRFDNSERILANEVIAEWLASDDESLRFDALALINHYAIGSAIQPLQRLADRLRAMSTPGAPYELMKANRLIEKLQNTR